MADMEVGKSMVVDMGMTMMILEEVLETLGLDLGVVVVVLTQDLEILIKEARPKKFKFLNKKS